MTGRCCSRPKPQIDFVQSFCVLVKETKRYKEGKKEREIEIKVERKKERKRGMIKIITYFE